MEDDREYDSSVLVEDQGVDIIPEVASSYKLVKGMMFSSTDQAFDFYSEYAKKAGFGVRKVGSCMHDGVLRTKYFTCCKEGHKPAKSYDSKVHDFVEGHNHSMVADCDLQFVRSARKLTHIQEEAIYELSNLNLGPVKAFNLMRTQYGGFEKVEYDAEMIVQRLRAKKTCTSDYSFEYDVNDNREYKMAFVPFTTIDNHCHSVTVGAGLLTSETIESYTWLFQMLLKSFGSAPKVIVTDQDPAMKQAIAFVFPNTRHRLCMWHIMKKVTDKVGADLCNNEDFKRRICDIVWTDSISLFEFEEKWQAIMVELELDKNKWLTDMYEIRFGWIPAFYRDEHFSGLMRTTSGSERENHFSGQATNSQLTLVEFFNHFDFCMEIQRYNGKQCDHDSRYTYPELETRSYIEREAARIYARSIFNDVQDYMNETVGDVSQFSACEEEGGYLRCKILDFNAYFPGFLEVVFKKDGEFGEDSTTTCSCKRFEQYVIMDASSSSSSSSKSASFKEALKMKIVEQIAADKACRERLTHEFVMLSNSLDYSDVITNVLVKMPASTIRVLAVLFMVDVGKNDSEQYNLDFLMSLLE
ncbi:protein FAR1-RELATED SEQUENCE 5-like [Bidens hawaiensis]|uniref:protein FAR1-RELATED SEQUENCE 5-like n=1 Tax=Bidens hawaiensis TaxID=980011 RepID=UPI0040499407